MATPIMQVQLATAKTFHHIATAIQDLDFPDQALKIETLDLTCNLASESSKKKKIQIMAKKTRLATGAKTSRRFNALMTNRWLFFVRVMFSLGLIELKKDIVKL